MMHLSSYYSNCKSANTWTEKVNLIGEKVLKPRINFCEYCNKPILVYGRLIPCKHVFCYGCASLCMSNATNNNNNNNNYQQQTNESNQLSTPNGKEGPNNETNNRDNFRDHMLENNNTRQYHNSDNHNDSNNSADHMNNRTTQSNISRANQNVCHRCGGRALRIERNALGSVFVCQVTNCRRTYLSARDLQAHVTHRHNKNNNHTNRNTASAGSLAAISSSPFISSSTLNHLSGQTHGGHHASSHMNTSPLTNGNHHSRENRDERHSSRDAYQRERERERDSKEYHRQSLQRAAQWAEASASILERGFNR